MGVLVPLFGRQLLSTSRPGLLQSAPRFPISP